MLVLGRSLRSRYPTVGVLNGTVAVAFVPSPTTWQWQIFGKSKKGSYSGILVCVFVSNVNELPTFVTFTRTIRALFSHAR